MGSFKIFPKIGDLSNPNNWRGINLLNVVSKIMSLHLVLDKIGTPLQFEPSPKTGCFPSGDIYGLDKNISCNQS